MRSGITRSRPLRNPALTRPRSSTFRQFMKGHTPSGNRSHSGSNFHWNKSRCGPSKSNRISSRNGPSLSSNKKPGRTRFDPQVVAARSSAPVHTMPSCYLAKKYPSRDESGRRSSPMSRRELFPSAMGGAYAFVGGAHRQPPRALRSAPTTCPTGGVHSRVDVAEVQRMRHLAGVTHLVSSRQIE